MGVLRRSVALGLAAGGRSAVALAVPVHAATRGHHGVGARALRGLTTCAVLGEMVVDKLPVTPSRLVPTQIAGRIVAGATGAAALAAVHRHGPGALLLAALGGGAGAFAGSAVGASWREWAADQGPDALRPDLRAALVEDAAVLVTARALAR